MGPTGFPYDLAPRADELPQKISCARVHLSEAPWVAFAIFFGRDGRNMILDLIHDTMTLSYVCMCDTKRKKSVSKYVSIKYVFKYVSRVFKVFSKSRAAPPP